MVTQVGEKAFRLPAYLLTNPCCVPGFDTLVERAVSIQHAERVLERLDIDCDGVLSFEEFRRCLEHMLDEGAV